MQRAMRNGVVPRRARLRWWGPSTPSFDHLVGAPQQSDRAGEPECLCGLEIDDKFDFDRLHDRQIRRLLALENPSGIDAQLAPRVGQAATITDQAAGGRELAPFV